MKFKDKGIKLIKPKGKKEKGILFAVPTHRGMPNREMFDCMKMAMMYLGQLGWKVYENWTTGANIARQRNTAVEEARECGAAYIIYIDDDMTFEPDAVHKLLEHNVEVVSGLCVKKTFPHHTTVSYWRDDLKSYQQIWDFPRGKVLDVDATGTAFLLVDMEVFDKIEKPYFSFCPSKYLGGNDDSIIGEDYYFCKQLKDVGYNIYVDTSVNVGHLGNYSFSYDHTLGVVEMMRAQGQDVNPEGTPKARVADTPTRRISTDS